MKQFILLLSFFSFTHLIAGEVKDYNETTFKSTIDNAPITILEFHASWCSTCKKQHKSLNTILKNPKFSEVQAIKIDYDNSDKLKLDFNITTQSTLILLKDGKFFSRIIGITKIEDITKFINKGL